MLARATLAGWPTQGYERADHPVHASIFATVEAWTDVPPDQIGVGIDGCGVVVFALPLTAMARAYARLVRAASQGDAVPATLVRAMVDQPFLVGGTDRFDSVLMEESQGRILCKIGAEGVHCAALLDQGVAVALKVEDGATRAQYPALLTLLQQMDALPNPLPPRLAEFMHKPIRNTRHEVVGQITVAAA
jgi:L-asparaginase II